MANRLDAGLAQNRWLHALNLPTVGKQVISFLPGREPTQFAQTCRTTRDIFQNKLLVDLTEMRAVLAHQVQEGLSPEENRLARRVQDECARLHLNPSLLEDAGACFKAITESQKRQAAACRILDGANGFAGVVAHSSLGLLPRAFRRGEALFLDPNVQQRLDRVLGNLWAVIKGQIPEGPEAGAPAAEIRAWMNTRESEEPLGRIARLNIQEFSILPPEIGKLSRLNWLACHGTRLAHLTGLPDEMRNLRQLTSIQLWGQGLREIPQIVDELPQLRTLQIRINLTPIEVLPDHIWRRFWRENFTDAFVKFILGNVRPPIHESGLDIGLLTNIPFGFWLQRTYSIPYLPISIAIYNALGNLVRRIPLALSCINILDVLFWVLLFPPIAVIQTLFNLPAFLFNFLLLYVVEPIATAIRDEMGYDRNVVVR